MSDDEGMAIDYDGELDEIEEGLAKIERDIEENFPDRPRNKGKTLPFHTLFKDLFHPLMQINKPIKPGPNQRKLGPDARSNKSPTERKRAVIERYISRWRRDVGDDFYPALRLII